MIEQEGSYLIGEKIDYQYKSSVNSDGQVLINLDLIMRSITNVINNAIFYADELSKKIVISTTVDKENFIISIWNNGSEFSEDVLANFGRLFYKKDVSRNYKTEHFGIGLAFVKQVMKLHSGEIILKNSSQGAQVQLKIPISNGEHFTI